MIDLKSSIVAVCHVLKLSHVLFIFCLIFVAPRDLFYSTIANCGEFLHFKTNKRIIKSALAVQRRKKVLYIDLHLTMAYSRGLRRQGVIN